MVSQEILEENTNEVAPILYMIKPKIKAKKKGRMKRFFSNEDVVLVLFTLGAGAIMITLLVIAGILGVSFPASTWWY